MKNQFADYETAKMLKELGFDEKCLAFHSNTHLIIHESNKKDMQPHWERTFIAPLWQQVKEWLWEKHKIIIEIQDISTRSEEEVGAIYESECAIRDGVGKLIDVLENESPIIAEIEGIKKAVKHLYLHSEIVVEDITSIQKTNDH